MHELLPGSAFHTPHARTVSPPAPREDSPHYSPSVFRKASCACGGGCSSCAGNSQLKVSDPADASEKAADAMADRVMGMPGDGPLVPAPAKNLLQRKENGGPALPNVPRGIGEVVNAPGSSLDARTRSFMESRFGHDFSGVRIHDNARAAASARAIDAQAYTVGSNIVFDSGRYDTASESGKRLLAHELAHVVQGGDAIHRYRDRPEKNPKSINFGVAGETDFQEDSFDIAKDKETKPWIEEIVVNLAPGKTDINGIPYWTGTAYARYYKDKLPNYHFPVSAGSMKLGMATESKEKESGKPGEKEHYMINRIEGPGYMSGKYSGRYPRVSEDGYGRKYTIDLKTANMHWALFYHNNEALHGGPRNESSHGCIHVDLYDIRHINYHSVKGLTKVQINYFNTNPGTWMLNRFEDFVELGSAAAHPPPNP